MLRVERGTQKTILHVEVDFFRGFGCRVEETRCRENVTSHAERRAEEFGARGGGLHCRLRAALPTRRDQIKIAGVVKFVELRTRKDICPEIVPGNIASDKSEGDSAALQFPPQPVAPRAGQQHMKISSFGTEPLKDVQHHLRRLLQLGLGQVAALGVPVEIADDIGILGNPVFRPDRLFVGDGKKQTPVNCIRNEDAGKLEIAKLIPRLGRPRHPQIDQLLTPGKRWLGQIKKRRVVRLGNDETAANHVRVVKGKRQPESRVDDIA